MMRSFKLILFVFSLFALVAIFAACDSACDHEYETTSMGADCENEVVNTKTCQKCGDSSETVISPTGHNFKEQTFPATCSTEGYTIYSCSCGFSYKGSIVSAKGHDYREIVSSPTCTKGGYTLYVCNDCDDAYKDKTLSAKGHSLVSETVAPDCESEGFVKYSCENCDYNFVGDYCKPEGHSFSATVSAPDCENEGFTEYSCKNCDHSFKTDFVQPIGHDFKETVISTANCIDRGETRYDCDCGYSYSKIVAPSGHHFEKTVISPTVSDMGYTEFSCDCGFSYKGNYRFYSEILDNAYAGNDQVVAKGIDISKWNHTVNSNGEYDPLDWVALKEAGVDYVILKIGSTPRENGTLGGLEPTFLMDYEGAKAAGLDVGVYYFTYAESVSDILKDAETILSWLDGLTFEYPIYLDLEDSSNEGYFPSQIASPILTEMCLTFFSELQKNGYYTGLYVNNEFLFNILQTDNMLDLFEIWYARYPSLEAIPWGGDLMNETVWNAERYGDNLGMWQFCMTGKLDAVKGDVDFNYAYKDYPALIAKNGFNGLEPSDIEDETESETEIGSETEIEIEAETECESESESDLERHETTEADTNEMVETR